MCSLYLEEAEEGVGVGDEGGLITSSRTIILRFTCHETTFSRFSKIEVVKNVKNVTVAPFCNRVLPLYLS